MGHEMEDMGSKMTDAQVKSSGIKGKIEELQKAKDSLTKELEEVQGAHANLLQEYSLRVDNITCQKKQNKSLKAW